jgi:hypothetical protein
MVAEIINKMGFNFGVEDKTHTIKGTTFKVKSATRRNLKIG